MVLPITQKFMPSGDEAAAGRSPVGSDSEREVDAALRGRVTAIHGSALRAGMPLYGFAFGNDFE